MIGFLKFVGMVFLILVTTGLAATKSTKFEDETYSNARIVLYWIDKWAWVAVAVFLIVALGDMY